MAASAFVETSGVHYRYRALGLTLMAEFPCPGFWPASPDDASRAVAITFGPVPEALDHPLIRRPLTEIGSGNRCLHRVPGIARYLVDGHSRIVIDPHPETALERILTFLRGTPLAFACHLWNLIPLNTACVAVDGRAVLLGSGPAYGKSTMTAALAQRGHTLMADAMCALDTTDPAAPLIWPSFPDVSLWPDSLAALDMEPPPTAAPGPGGRFRIDATPWFDPAPKPPSVLAVIRKALGATPSWSASSLGRLQRFETVANLVCLIDIARTLPGNPSRLDAIARLSSLLTMAEFRFPPNLDHVPAQADLLAAAARQGGEQACTTRSAT